MRVLQVIHQFPPYSSQGSEVYCDNLSRELAKTEDVRVFHVSNVAHAWWRRLRRENIAGLETYHCVDGGNYARLSDWPNHFLRRSFRAALDDYRPAIVHFHNYLSLGDDLVTLAHENGAAVVYTLHDYGLICPNTLLRRDDGVLCGKADPDFFQDCCPIPIRTGLRRVGWAWSARLPALARWQMYARQDPRPWRKAVLTTATSWAARGLGHPRSADVQQKRTFYLTHTRRILRDVDLFLAPSRFLQQQYLACGLPSQKIEFLRYGLRHFPAAPHRDGDGIRFGYIGALHPHKGIELLLEAFTGVEGAATLHVYGSVFGSPISASFWRRVADRDKRNVVFHGAYDNRRVGEILAGLDAVIVPSVWYENSPLTIQEAFIAGVPVITADAGGMAELVRDGVDGLHFRFGDAADLREKLARVVRHPELLDRLRRGIVPVPGLEAHTAAMLTRYRTLADQRAPVPDLG